MRPLSNKTIVLGLLVLLILPIGSVRGQSSAFSYQGRLSSNGAALTGLYDFRFALYDSTNNPGQLLAGPLPTISTSVTNGLFTVSLDFGTSVFTGAARWMEVAVRTNGLGSFIVVGRVPLLAAPYATHAAAAADVDAGSVVKSVNNLRDDVTLIPGNNVSITPSGNTLTISAAGVGGSGIWSLNGNTTYYASGKVGIGTSTPSSQLEVTGNNALGLTGFGPLLTFKDSGTGYKRSMFQSVGGDLNIFTESYLSGANTLSFLKLADNGNVGIGYATPESKLTIAGPSDALSLIANGPLITFKDSATGYKRSVFQSVGGDLNIFTESYLSGANLFSFLKVADNGNVGIGSSQPVGKLEVVGHDAVRLIGSQPYLTFHDDSAGYARSRIQGTAGGMTMQTESYINGSDPFSFVKVDANGNVGIGQNLPRQKLDVGGNVSVNGNVSQERDKGGLVKAMLCVDSDGTIILCYNSVAPGNVTCGITVNHFANGGYGIDFGFPVVDRFVSVTAGEGHNSVSFADANRCARYEIKSGNTINVRTFVSGQSDSTIDSEFMIIVY